MVNKKTISLNLEFADDKKYELKIDEDILSEFKIIDEVNPADLVVIIVDIENAVEIFKHQLYTLSKQSDLVIVDISRHALPLIKLQEISEYPIHAYLPWNKNKYNVKKLNEIVSRWLILEKTIIEIKEKFNLVGNHKVFHRALQKLIESVLFSDCPISIRGESGTGKEVSALILHDLMQKRVKGSLVTVDCTTLSKDLSGSELFGHEKGSFTSAFSSREGAISEANGGLLFLDEIGELPLEIQSSFLRVLQEKKYRKIGTNIYKTSDFRLITATNKNIPALIDEGLFREDLYFRIKGVEIKMPSLRERKTDILDILESRFLNSEMILSEASRKLLLSYDYPGNIRELLHIADYIKHKIGKSGYVSLLDLPPLSKKNKSYKSDHETSNEDIVNPYLIEMVSQVGGLKELKKVIGDKVIELMIKQYEGNLQQAAKHLKVSDRLLQKYLYEKN